MKFYRKESMIKAQDDIVTDNKNEKHEKNKEIELNNDENCSEENQYKVILNGERHENEGHNRINAGDEEHSLVSNEEAGGVSNTHVSNQLVILYTRAARTIQVLPFTVIMSIFLLVVLFSFMKGGKKTESLIGISFCSIGFWVFMVAFMIVMLSINIATGFYLYTQQKLKETLGFEHDEHDIQWSVRNIIIISTVGLVAGAGSGLLGIGGGAIIGPIMLMLNVRPEVSAATSSFMVAFTSSIAIIQYATAGRIILEYALCLAALALIGAIIGIFWLKELSEKYERPSLLVFVLAIIMAIATFLVPFYGITTLIQDGEDDKIEYGFSSYC